MPFSSHIIILSASPSKEIPISALCFFVKALIFFGKVDPHLSFIFNPLGEIPISKTFAPRDLNNFGPDLWAAPFAQSIAIFNPFRLNEGGKFFFNISIYLSVPFSNLFTLPKILGLERLLIIFESINFSIFFSILSESFKPSGPNNFNPLSKYGLWDAVIIMPMLACIFFVNIARPFVGNGPNV